MSSSQFPTHHSNHAIPVRILLASLQEYSAYVHQWQTHAEDQRQQAHTQKLRADELQRELEEMRVAWDTLVQVMNTQRQLILSQENDIALLVAQQQVFCSGSDSSYSSPNSNTRALELEPLESDPYPAGTEPECSTA
ncbi:hypothetical protein QBC46DRAFT_275601 [Diplogelasinospora grovesii]|uniref:Uncharacterized protein n=1 Tax=Diplogelasinospora grovesii TaxID=303347 RepID=A0AAN6MVX2_9PEZI|nr:hypothetical protein QBC46DRAFT_275601 [Diplogelasinospora grovesii]